MAETLREAAEELTALKNDLPQFKALLDENQAAAEALKSKRTPLTEQLEAKARANTAPELLK